MLIQISVLVLIQFATCKEELLRLLDSYVEMLGEKISPYAVEVKVSHWLAWGYFNLHMYIHIIVQVFYCHKVEQPLQDIQYKVTKHIYFPFVGQVVLQHGTSIIPSVCTESVFHSVSFLE